MDLLEGCHEMCMSLWIDFTLNDKLQCHELLINYSLLQGRLHHIKAVVEQS